MQKLAEQSLIERPRPWRQRVRWALTTLLPCRLLLASGPVRSGKVCLTFDDGPHPEHTPRLLDQLRESGVRATFFVVGRAAEKFPHVLRRIVAEGHRVGNHTYLHREPETVSARELLEEVDRTQELLTRLTGLRPTLFRPPHGKVTVAKMWRLWWARLTVVLWNADTKDYARTSPADLREWVAGRVFRGGDVVLMHDTCPHTVEVMPDLIRTVRACGLGFATPDEWLR